MASAGGGLAPTSERLRAAPGGATGEVVPSAYVDPRTGFEHRGTKLVALGKVEFDRHHDVEEDDG